MGVLVIPDQADEFVVFLIKQFFHSALMRPVWRLFNDFYQLHSAVKFRIRVVSILGAHKLIG